jgi:hypothetical protein
MPPSTGWSASWQSTALRELVDRQRERPTAQQLSARQEPPSWRRLLPARAATRPTSATASARSGPPAARFARSSSLDVSDTVAAMAPAPFFERTTAVHTEKRLARAPPSFRKLDASNVRPPRKASLAQLSAFHTVDESGTTRTARRKQQRHLSNAPPTERHRRTRWHYPTAGT